MADKRCADGVFSHGERLVRKGGRIKAAGNWYQSNRIKGWVGRYVHVQMNDYWLSEILAFDYKTRKTVPVKIESKEKTS